ncbi:MAG: hypothetical protein A2V67_15535 [Deltaproteobacteria bacterium RBG_13_61_14]|nr:MAG: hypothetical protein A2V67_15535 [Deltaproteobacteria bacterium RBG_13_61_14]
MIFARDQRSFDPAFGPEHSGRGKLRPKRERAIFQPAAAGPHRQVAARQNCTTFTYIERGEG